MSNGKLYSGKEMLTYRGESLPYGILQFWRINLSELILNVNRGSFAEYIVLCALEQGGHPCIDQMKSGMEPWDISGPRILINGESRVSRIEVKSAASVQFSTKPEQEPINLSPTKLTFEIRRKRDWNSKDTEPHHNNDLYVFCHYKATRKSDDILNLDLWDFYVFPTYRIREDKSLTKQSTISVWRLHKIGIQTVQFGSLHHEICKVLADIERHYEDFPDNTQEEAL